MKLTLYTGKRPSASQADDEGGDSGGESGEEPQNEPTGNNTENTQNLNLRLEVSQLYSEGNLFCNFKA